MNDVPKILYKYKPFNQYSLQTILTNSIYFPTPIELNDPLDSSPSIKITDAWDANDILYHLRLRDIRTKIEDIFLTEDMHVDLKNEIDVLCTTHAFKSCLDEHIISEEEGYERLISESLVRHLKPGIFSMTEDAKNHLMWSHYADEHKGYCIGYDTTETDSDLIQVKYDNEAGEVAMEDILELIDSNYDQTLGQALFKKVLGVKRKNWAYEKEWRYVIKGSGLRDSKLKIESVTFGLRFCPDIRAMMMQIKSLKGIKFYQVERDHKNYNLTRKIVKL